MVAKLVASSIPAQSCVTALCLDFGPRLSSGRILREGRFPSKQGAATKVSISFHAEEVILHCLVFTSPQESFVPFWTQVPNLRPVKGLCKAVIATIWYRTLVHDCQAAKIRQSPHPKIGFRILICPSRNYHKVYHAISARKFSSRPIDCYALFLSVRMLRS